MLYKNSRTVVKGYRVIKAEPTRKPTQTYLRKNPSDKDRDYRPNQSYSHWTLRKLWIIVSMSVFVQVLQCMSACGCMDLRTCVRMCTRLDDRRPAQGPDRMCAELSAAVLVVHTHTHLNELSVLALNVSFSLIHTLTHSHLATTNQTSRATDAHGGRGWQQESMLESPYQQCREQTVCFIF